ncbi:MAG: DNA-directed RNA polymerase subunit alpha [Endomicrobium sp.]|jgi:DNA-directed RNA polymerase subunit alpha|nr:DNA-directed RNA polymerase subunit alpha [Endomicrobium sp.]
MKIIDLKKIRKLVLDKKTATKFYGRFIIEPFDRGYGYTIGNSLRRILLSSIDGAAITSVKIKDALHEFSVIKGVKEDVAHIILNLKKVRVKLNSKKSETLYLSAKNIGRITAGDIKPKSGVEIMNPEQEIANIDTEASLEMELRVSTGNGYVLAEEVSLNDDNFGSIAIDSLFSPVIKVNYEVENTRVEQVINYDRLVMEIWTDGTVSPNCALSQSAIILKNSLDTFIDDKYNDYNNKDSNNVCENEKIFDQLINVMNFSTRTLNGLKNANIFTVKDIVELSERDILSFDNLGKRSLEEIKNKLRELNLSFKMKVNNGEKNDKNI